MAVYEKNEMFRLKEPMIDGHDVFYFLIKMVCQKLHLMCAAIPIAPIWRKPE